MLRSGIMRGTVRHHRFKPREHAFAYPVFMVLLDLAEKERLFGSSPLWSVERFNLVSFHRSDYLAGDADLGSEVKRRIRNSTGNRFEGRILLLTNPRYLGFCFNPVSFYFCYESDPARPDYILADINNTPWNEKHCYVLDCREHSGRHIEFDFDKQFHVSPFMPMDLKYLWRFRLDDASIAVGMDLRDGDSTCFRAGLSLERAPFSAAEMLRAPIAYPFATLAVITRIYWQALRLRVKRVPFHEHPKNRLSEVNYEHNC